MRISAKADYAVRAVLELATVDEGLIKGERIAQAQSIPLKSLENILIDLRHAGIVHAQRGAEGGYRLARKPADVTLGEVIRAVEGPLASVRGEKPMDAALVAVLGLLLGVVSALAWHWDPIVGVWAGLFEENVDLGYPAVGLALAVVFLGVVRPDGTRRAWLPGRGRQGPHTP